MHYKIIYIYLLNIYIIINKTSTMNTTTNTTNASPEFNFTMAYAKSKNGLGFYGFVREVAGAFSQAATIDELKVNLKDAVHCIFESNKMDEKKNLIKEGVPMQELILC